jgi:hypothetical protein
MFSPVCDCKFDCKLSISEERLVKKEKNNYVCYNRDDP